MSARSVSVRDAAAGIAVLAAVAIGVLAFTWWRNERQRERPRLVAGLFVTLTPGPAWTPGAERWLVAVNLGCGHCRNALARVANGAAARAARARVAALLVDTSSPPSASAVPSGEVLWDARQVWRRRWGRRAYGEVLCFDAAGRCTRVLPPDDGGDTDTRGPPAGTR